MSCELFKVSCVKQTYECCVAGLVGDFLRARLDRGSDAGRRAVLAGRVLAAVRRAGLGALLRRTHELHRPAHLQRR